jgi:hypothetical protein
VERKGREGREENIVFLCVLRLRSIVTFVLEPKAQSPKPRAYTSDCVPGRSLLIFGGRMAAYALN